MSIKTLLTIALASITLGVLIGGFLPVYEVSNFGHPDPVELSNVEE